MRSELFALAAVVVVLLVSCREERDRPDLLDPLTGDPDISSIEEVLGTAAPLAYAATLAMAAMKGENIPCVSVNAQCASYPCSSGSVTVALDQACTLPLGSVGNGAIIVSGNWTSDSEATLVAVCEGAKIDSQDLFVRQGAFAASLTGDTIIMTYADQNVSINGTRQAAIAQSGWTVKVSTSGSLGDLTDDITSITGTRQYVGSTAVSDVVLTEVEIRGSCARNPTDGTASVMEIDGLSTGWTTLSFHSACDGNADVTATMYLSWIGDEIPIHLLK